MIKENDGNQKKAKRSLVLIDEIDKAPLDFPNDILNEIENFYFRIPEMGNQKVEAPKSLSPVVIITSNSEKHLPDPFLRRCVYHHIRFPEPDRMKRIVEARIRNIPTSSEKPESPSESFLNDAVALFYALRDRLKGERKQPSTSELMVWMQAMREFSRAENPIAEDRQAAVRTLGAVVKTGDMKSAREFVETWKQAP